MGIALSPLSIAAVVLALLSSRSKAVGLAYAAGWVAGLTVVGVALLFVGDQFLGGEDGASSLRLAVKALLGAVLVGLGVRQLFAGRGSDSPASTQPAWMSAMRGITVPKAFGFAFVWGSLQPKNLVLLAAGMVALAQSGLEPRTAWVFFAAFVAIASVSVLVPVSYYVIVGARADARLDRWERWLQRHSSGIMGGFLIVVGLVLLADAVPRLLG